MIFLFPRCDMDLFPGRYNMHVITLLITMGFITIFHHLFWENIFFGGTFSRHPRSRDSFVSWLLWRFPKSKTLPVVIACWGGREDACLRSPQENRCSKRRLCLVWNIFFSKFCRWVHCVLLVLWSTQIYHIIIKNQGHTFACFYLTLPCLVYIRLNYITLLCCVSSSLFFFRHFATGCSRKKIAIHS